MKNVLFFTLLVVIASCQKKHCYKCDMQSGTGTNAVITEMIICDVTQKQIDNSGYSLAKPCEKQ